MQGKGGGSCLPGVCSVPHTESSLPGCGSHPSVSTDARPGMHLSARNLSEAQKDTLPEITLAN